MKNIFEVLRESHNKQRLLLSTLVQTSGDSDIRRSLYGQLKDELEQHAIAEERYFYAPLIEEDMTVEHSRHGIAEHHAIDKIINTLDDTDFSSSAWLTHLKELQHKVEHHLQEEEKVFFKLAGKVISEQDKESLANKYEAEMNSF
ncbi:MAG: hemerythrin domain-containing protein [Gammaproteobacteria bacterium]|nr:hemerythrin domain-containing protein [Gammaproteobacteria bacterium]